MNWLALVKKRLNNFKRMQENDYSHRREESNEEKCKVHEIE